MDFRQPGVDNLLCCHQLIDGAPFNEVFFDWPSTNDHLLYLANHFGLRLEFQWDAKGLYKRIEERGML
jgi:hypothetical protein